MALSPEVLDQFFRQLIPGTTVSKYAGFRGNRQILEQRRNGTLLSVSGWHQYSRRIGRYINRTGLIVRDNTGLHLVRVPPGTETVQEALAWLMPVAVQRRKKDGHKVIRQGDFYFVNGHRANNFTALRGTAHRVEILEEYIVIHHPQHGQTILPGTTGWRAYHQKSTVTGQGRGRD